MEKNLNLNLSDSNNYSLKEIPLFTDKVLSVSKWSNSSYGIMYKEQSQEIQGCIFKQPMANCVTLNKSLLFLCPIFLICKLDLYFPSTDSLISMANCLPFFDCSFHHFPLGVRLRFRFFLSHILYFTSVTTEFVVCFGLQNIRQQDL